MCFCAVFPNDFSRILLKAVWFTAADTVFSQIVFLKLQRSKVEICRPGLNLHRMYSTMFTPNPKLQFSTKEAFQAAGRQTRLSLCIQKKTQLFRNCVFRPVTHFPYIGNGPSLPVCLFFDSITVGSLNQWITLLMVKMAGHHVPLQFVNILTAINKFIKAVKKDK